MNPYFMEQHSQQRQQKLLEEAHQQRLAAQFKPKRKFRLPIISVRISFNHQEAHDGYQTPAYRSPCIDCA